MILRPLKFMKPLFLFGVTALALSVLFFESGCRLDEEDIGPGNVVIISRSGRLALTVAPNPDSPHQPFYVWTSPVPGQIASFAREVMVERTTPTRVVVWLVVSSNQTNPAIQTPVTHGERPVGAQPPQPEVETELSPQVQYIVRVRTADPSEVSEVKFELTE